MTLMQRLAAHAVPVTLPEIDQVIRRAFRATSPRVEKTSWGEVVYILTPDPEDPTNVIRVQTSVFQGQAARGEGEDSIRVVLMNTKTKRPIAGKEQRVHRVENWRDNLRKRIDDAIEKFEDLQEEREKAKQQGAGRQERERFSPPAREDDAVTWTKLRDGSWGLRATRALNEGSFVRVMKRDGSSASVRVGKLVFSKDGIFIYAAG